MNLIEVSGIAFIAIVLINLTSMIWPIKDARLDKMPSVN